MIQKEMAEQIEKNSEWILIEESTPHYAKELARKINYLSKSLINELGRVSDEKERTELSNSHRQDT